jgi:hypothetical protein
MRVPYGSHSKQRLFAQTTLTGWALYSTVSTTEELLGRNGSCLGLEIRQYGLGISRADHATPAIHKKSRH